MKGLKLPSPPWPPQSSPLPWPSLLTMTTTTNPLTPTSTPSSTHTTPLTVTSDSTPTEPAAPPGRPPLPSSSPTPSPPAPTAPESTPSSTPSTPPTNRPVCWQDTLPECRQSRDSSPSSQSRGLCQSSRSRQPLRLPQGSFPQATSSLTDSSPASTSHRSKTERSSSSVFVKLS